ncbi:hypothetical protein FHS20_003917 [Phyllobacterium endophyticum]|nr:hypothetical protein [Phyllobacterium endophyticum]
MNALTMTWGMAGLRALGVITRPSARPEAIWAPIGVVPLVPPGLIGPADAWAGRYLRHERNWSASSGDEGMASASTTSSVTAPAAVAWGAYFGWLDIAHSSMLFMGSVWTAAIFTILAVVELVTDQLPSTPSRKVPIQHTHYYGWAERRDNCSGLVARS